MKKQAYGLVDASRGFYLEIRKTLEELGCVVSKLDPAMYLYLLGVLVGLILTHVDNFLYGSGEDIFDKFLSH